MFRYFSSSGHRRVILLLLAMSALQAGAAATTGSVPVAAARRDLPETPLAEAYPTPLFDRYLPIINRMPFGVSLPPPVLPASAAAAAAASTAADPAKNFELFEIVRTPVGEVVVGFTDGNPKPPRSLLLAVGEESDGYRVDAADIDAETATLEKDGVSFLLRLRSNTPTNSAGLGRTPWSRGGMTNLPGMSALPSRMPRQNPDAMPMPNSVGGIDRLLGADLRDNSYVSRLRVRRDQLVKQSEDAQHAPEQAALTRTPTVSTDELDKRLRATNLNLIRQGLKPIGTIELTPEEDATLVSEGVLPAQ